MATTLTGYVIAMAGPQPPRFTEHFRSLGALLAEPSRQTLLRLVVQRRVHAVIFNDRISLTTLINAAQRIGLGPHLLAAFASEVIATGTPEAVSPLAERGLPVLAGRPALEHLITAALLARRREFTARNRRFLLQGNALRIDGGLIWLEAPLAALLRALADHAGTTLSRATLARLCVLPRRNRGAGIELTISQLRTALGERSWLITTVSRRGYRLAVDSQLPPSLV